jgi:hypothetical protein
MAIVGHAAATMNIFLDVPRILRALAQSMNKQEGPAFQLSPLMTAEIDRMPDPLDPTEMVDYYYHDWWNHDAKWKTQPQVMVDREKAFMCHIQRVSLIISPSRQFC